jgi:GNAT superfamily N-acetyltransferase
MPLAMTASATRAYTIEEVDLAAADDRLLRELTDLTNEIARERVPEDPPLPFESLASRVRNRPKMVRIRDWLARAPTGDLVARGYIVRYDADTNQHLREASIEVLPAHRRKGVAKRLFRRLVGAAGDRDDIVIGFFSTDRVPAAAEFLRRIGAKETLTMHTNQLQLSQLDRAMVREWAGIDPAGYRLEWIDGEVPEAAMGNVIVAYDTMNTAPRGNMAMDDWHTTPEQVREWDRSRRASGRERRLVLAIHDATGETAGYTELAYDPKIPPVVWQQGTAVIPAHRGQGIGKWIKAAMLERALRDWPQARLVRTGNADSNAPMLAINTRLGFKPAWAQTIWEVAIADARRYVESVIA